MFRFITKRPLWINILIGLVLMAAMVLLFVNSLNWITHHGESKTVPSVVGKNAEEMKEFLEKQNFEMVIQDSVYYDTLPPSVIIRQVPEADAVVKVNRTVYVTINRVVPPDVEMPNLIGYTFRNAEMVLKNMGLKVGDTTFKPDFAKNTILEQLYNGNPISAGTKLKMGSSISLVLGNGVGSMDMAVPKLIGLTYNEGKILMEAQGLTPGAVIADPDVKDTGNAFIYKQNPQPKTLSGQQLRIRPGQMMDIWLSMTPPVTDSATQSVNKTQTEP